jgi:hypothetical protein
MGGVTHLICSNRAYVRGQQLCLPACLPAVMTPGNSSVYEDDANAGLLSHRSQRGYGSSEGMDSVGVLSFMSPTLSSEGGASVRQRRRSMRVRSALSPGSTKTKVSAPRVDDGSALQH